MPKILLKVFLLPLRGYRKYISPALPPRCKYYPTCSTYALRAIERHGIIKGFFLASWRLLRCNPFSDGGVDHVPEKPIESFNSLNISPRS